MPRRRLRARRVPRSAEGARHRRARARSESRDGRGLPRARARRRRGGRRSATSTRCRTRRSAACSPRRWSSTCSRATCCAFLELAFHKLRPGAPIVLETLNPACWTAFFDSFIRDITHVWPLHPETLRYLVLGQRLLDGAHRVPIAGRAAGSPAARCRRRPPACPVADLAEAFNANVEKLERADVHVPRLRDRRRPR